MKKKRDRQAPTSIGKTSAHRSFLFFCRKFSSAFATFLCIRQATSLISRNHHRSFSASDGEPGKQEGRMVPPTSQQEEFCPCVSLVDKTSLQYTHWHAVQPRTAHSCGSEAYAQAQLAVAKPVAATARCLNGHCSGIPSVLARVKKNGDLGGSKLVFFSSSLG